MTCSTALPNIWRNADYKATITFPQSFSLSGASARMQVRKSPGSPVLYLDIGMAPTANGSFFEVTFNQVRLLIKRADLQSLPASAPVEDPLVLAYDIVLTDNTGFRAHLIEGPFVVNTGVTL